MQLSPNFTLDEFTRSSTAERHGIENEPNIQQIAHLVNTAKNMELVRAYLQKPIIVDSAFRCTQLNMIVGGSEHSAHLTGDAVDFICPAYNIPDIIFLVLKDSGIKYDQLICEGSWIHISFAETMRQQNLITRFIDGVAHYTIERN